jgi:hypothetical protein
LDAHDFWRAVERFTVADLPLDVRPDAEERLRSCLAAGGPVLLGESHGAAENALVVFTLIRRFAIRALGLEWQPDLERAVYRYQEGDGLDFGRFASSADGRITAGHLAVLRELHRRGDLDRLVLFDAWGLEGWSGRDRSMADRLLSGLDGGPSALVVAGNLHTRLEPHEHGVPMGHHVAGVRPSTLEVRMRYLSGDIFNLGHRKLGPSRPRRAAEPVLRVHGDGLELTLPRVHLAVVPNPELR